MRTRTTLGAVAVAAGMATAGLGIGVAHPGGLQLPSAFGEPDGPSPTIPTFEVLIPDSGVTASTDTGSSSSTDTGSSSSTDTGSSSSTDTGSSSSTDTGSAGAAVETGTAAEGSIGAAQAVPAPQAPGQSDAPSGAPAPEPTPVDPPSAATPASAPPGTSSGPPPDAFCQPWWPCWFPTEPTPSDSPAICLTSPPAPDAPPPAPFEFLGEMVAPSFDQGRQQWGFWKAGNWVPLYAYGC